jgi:hypothetical protein
MASVVKGRIINLTVRRIIVLSLIEMVLLFAYNIGGVVAGVVKGDYVVQAE